MTKEHLKEALLNVLTPNPYSDLDIRVDMLIYAIEEYVRNLIAEEEIRGKE